MEPTFSEFSYGYALTQELASGRFGSLVAAPIFPSLVREGRAGGGYDIQLPFTGVPLFLQFKLSYYLHRSNSLEWEQYFSPYYRMYLRPLRYSDQHDLLFELERIGSQVFYVAPKFHKVEELNDAYASENVCDRSAFFSPVDIGTLPTIDQHYLTFNSSSVDAFLWSGEPRKLKRPHSSKDIEDILTMQIMERGSKIDNLAFERLTERMIGILDNRAKKTDRLKQFQAQIESQNERIHEMSSLAAYLAHLFFDAELFIVGESSNQV
jgi:hypothetical protein